MNGKGHQKGYRKPHGHPKRHAKREKQPHGEKNQQKSLDTIDKQHVQAITYNIGTVLGNGDDIKVY